jgi:hypothetical protein
MVHQQNSIELMYRVRIPRSVQKYVALTKAVLAWTNRGGANALTTCTPCTSYSNIITCVYLNSMLQIVDPVISLITRKLLPKHFGVKHGLYD